MSKLLQQWVVSMQRDRQESTSALHEKPDMVQESDDEMQPKKQDVAPEKSGNCRSALQLCLSGSQHLETSEMPHAKEMQPAR